VADLVNVVDPAVVRIDVTGPGFQGEGSGFIVDESGYVITNYHVVEDTTSIKVTLATGDSYSAGVVNDDVNRDVALLLIKSTRTDFPVIELGSASDAQVGDALLIGGFPLGMELTGPATFTQGIVSALRTINGLNYIQTDAPINPGNSGGPVIDMQGTLVGICVAAVTDPSTTVEGLGLVIPVGDLLKFIDSGTVSCTNCHYSS
jgi:S1-C subfamily serine protease